MKTILALSLASLALTAGCQNPGPSAPSRPRADITDHRGTFFGTTYDDQIRESTAVLQEVVGTDQFGLMTVTVPIRSTVNRTLSLEYTYEFYDAAGRKLEGVTWLPIVLEAGAPGTIQFTSTQTQARDFRVTIRFQR